MDRMLLDCTLRDGGYVNDWMFGYSSIRNIVRRLDIAGIELIEVGLIDASCKYDKNRSIFPDIQSIDKTLNGLSTTQSMLVAMIDFGAFPAENIVPCSQSILTGIRVIFKKNDADSALRLCSAIKEQGYKVFVNPVSLTSYSDMEILHLIGKINDIEPFGMSIVDTYGLMLRDEILHFVDLVDNNLESGIILGFHSHNNQQMAFSNCCALLDRRNQHNIVIDASLFGMGKSAGNANLELVASYVNKAHNGKYKMEQLLDCIYTDIMKIYRKKPWGYNLLYYLSAINDCHPDYIKYLLEKNTLSVQGINEIVSQIPKNQKLSYSRELIDKSYLDYQSVSIDDSEAYYLLGNILIGKPLLLVFPGKSINLNAERIDEFIKRNRPIVISINFIPPQIDVDLVFIGNRQRYGQIADLYFAAANNRPDVVATSNILESNVPIAYKLNYERLVASDYEVADNSAILLLSFLKNLGVRKTALAGLDGFTANPEMNYSDPYMDMASAESFRLQSNQDLKTFLASLREAMTLEFITSSMFSD